MPSRVVITGAWSSSASSSRSSDASAYSTPWPAWITGRRASRSTRAAASTSRALAPAAVTLTGRYASSRASGTSSFTTSAGISTIAGPGRPMRITLMARRMTSATWPPWVIVSTDLVTEAKLRAELNKGNSWARSR